jgi:excisionase family DNA binding protein
MSIPESLLTPKQVASKFNVSLALVYAWLASGALTCYRLGAAGKRGCIRVAESDLAAFLESLKTQKGPKAKPPAPPKSPRIKLQNLKLKPT